MENIEINQPKTLRRMRTIKQILNEIKKDDPKTPITKYLLLNIAKTNNIFNCMLGNKHVYDMDLLLRALGIVYE